MSTIDVLLRWCTDNDIWIEQRLQLGYDNEMGIGVYSKELKIPPLASLVHIHKRSVISTRSCSISEHIEPGLYGPEAQHALSLALYAELLKGTSSRWFGYLQSLPDHRVDLPVFWVHDTLHSDDGQEAMMWLRGTAAEQRLKNISGNSLKAITDYYTNIAEPILCRFAVIPGVNSHSQPSLEGFYHAFSLVSSRAFFVDAYHGLSMVPIADAFNHAQENHVHLQSEFSVCPQCGALHECSHDRDGTLVDLLAERSPPSETHVVSSVDTMDDFYEMVSNAPIPPYSQVFNTYGETLTNAQLLSQYGFIIDANENDCLNWDANEVYRFLFSGSDSQPHNKLLSVWNGVLQGTRDNGVLDRISDSQLVFHPEDSPAALCLNSDGKISCQLWILLALPLIDRGNSNQSFLSEALLRLLEYQLGLEILTETDGDYVTKSGLAEDSLAATTATLARSVIGLCVSRKANLGKAGGDHLDLGSIMDTLPLDMVRSRQAMSIVMSERSILDSCEHAWNDILTITYL